MDEMRNIKERLTWLEKAIDSYMRGSNRQFQNEIDSLTLELCDLKSQNLSVYTFTMNTMRSVKDDIRTIEKRLTQLEGLKSD